MSTSPIHRDHFGSQITVGAVGAFNRPHYKGLETGRVVGLTPQKVRVTYPLGAAPPDERTTTVYPRDLVLDPR